MAEETLFDQAWDQWRRTVTAALVASDTSDRTRRALAEAGAFDPADGLLDRDWALALMTDQGPARRTAIDGLSEEESGRLVALLRRHPTPAAGG